MTRATRKDKTEPRISPPPNDGREWITSSEAAELFGITRSALLFKGKKLNWTSGRKSNKQMWILKKDVLDWLNFLKKREEWRKRRRPKHWQREYGQSPNTQENKDTFNRIFWTTKQAAAFLGVSTYTVTELAKRGRIPVFTLGNPGKGRRNYYSPRSLEIFKEDEEYIKNRARWEKAKETMRQGVVGREVYKLKRKPRVYKNVPAGWLTVRQTADYLGISLRAVHNIHLHGGFDGQHFTGKWDSKKRPWFFHIDQIEEYKNSEFYQRKHQSGLQAVQAMLARP